MSQELIALKDKYGQQLLEEADFNQPWLHKVFAKQQSRKACGIQSCAMVLSAASLAQAQFEDKEAGVTDLPFTETSLIQDPKTAEVKSEEAINTPLTGGLTLAEMVQILKNHGQLVDVYHAQDTSVGHFRDMLRSALSDQSSQKAIVVNYKMSTLGQGSHLGGHHSPVVAYHAATDKCLILDTWPETEVCWAKVDNLFAAMQTEDKTGVSRGYCVVTHQ